MEQPLICRDKTTEPGRKRRRKRRRRCKRHPDEGPHSPSCRGSRVKGRSNTAQRLVRILPSLKPVLDYLHVREDVFTREQIMGHLTEYIKQKALFDPTDPRKVYCQNDQLAMIFGCKEFSTSNACQLLLQNLETVSTTDSGCSCSESDQQSIGEPSTNRYLPSTSTTVNSLEAATGSKRQRIESCSDVSTCSTNQAAEQPYYGLYFSPFRPDINSDDNGEYCLHYKQMCDHTTDIVTDTSDDLFFLNETDGEQVVAPETDEFAEEYEPITYSEEEHLISLRRQFGDDDDDEEEDEVSSFDTEIDEGDDGGDELDENDGNSDSEIEDEDKWKCESCSERNHPMTRNCRKCWNVRKDWYPSALHRSMSDPAQNTTQPTRTEETPGSDTASTSHNIAEITDVNDGEKCIICLKDPPNGCIIHGQTGHQVCCVGCSRKLQQAGKPCPVCRKRIHRVIMNFSV